MGRKVLDALLLDRAGVERVEIIDGRNAVAVAKETATKMPADESRPAGDADVHFIF